MSQTLYRKYRSQRFADIIGQASVIRVLQNSIMRGRLNHAYLFAGPRGTGKTSIARIFAKALNCLDPQNGDACGVCAVCTSIASGTAVDVVEIDAASNRGIDDIRDLRERVNYAPLELQRKVYIIDEVHMITGPAWNALLKTLEEPPSHVVFCLCTTEANKVPITILSRCIRFDFQRLPQAALAAHLEAIADAENFKLDPGCGMKLARLAEGSARDAISLLDQLTVFCENSITASDIDELFQLGDPVHVRAIVDSLLGGDSAAALGAWDGMLERGVDAGTFLLQLAEEIKSRYLEQPTPQTKHALDAIWQGLNLLKYDNFPALLVELTLIEAAGSGPAAALPAPASEPRAAPSAPESIPIRATPAMRLERRQDIPAASPVPPKPAQAPEPETRPTVQPSPIREAVAEDDFPPAASELFESYREKVRSMRMTTYVLLIRGVSAELEGNRLVLSFDDDCRQALAYAGQPDNLAVLREAARQLYGQHTVIDLRRAGSIQARVEPADMPEREQPAAVPSPPGEAEPPDVADLPLESNGSGDRPATFEDVIRLFGAGEVEEQ